MTDPLTAAVARMTAAGAPRVYEVGQVPNSPVYPYAVVSVDLGDPDGYRVTGQHSWLMTRISVQAFGRTVSEVNKTIARSRDAFLDQQLTETDTPCRQDLLTRTDWDPDDHGVVYALVVYAYTSGSN